MPEYHEEQVVDEYGNRRVISERVISEPEGRSTRNDPLWLAMGLIAVVVVLFAIWAMQPQPNQTVAVLGTNVTPSTIVVPGDTTLVPVDRTVVQQVPGPTRIVPGPAQTVLAPVATRTVPGPVVTQTVAATPNPPDKGTAFVGPIRTTGTIQSISSDNLQVTIDHNAIPQIKQPATTATYRLRDANLIGELQAGQRVNFVLQRDETTGDWVIIELSQASAE